MPFHSESLLHYNKSEVHALNLTLVYFLQKAANNDTNCCKLLVFLKV